MEKIAELIEKLRELKNDQASLSTLSYYAQLLYAEIMHVKAQLVQEQKSMPNVSVILPAGISAKTESLHTAVRNASFEKEVKKPAHEKLQPVLFEIPGKNGYSKKGAALRELNEVMATHQSSLNDLLKEQKTEVAEKLRSVPVTNLTGAIDFNEKYQYIDDLFKGDQDMYERSVKTINAFPNLREAENWMERELRLKLGWIENDNTVQAFYSHVRMRFA